MDRRGLSQERGGELMRDFLKFALFFAALLWAGAASALPQYAIRSARQCDTCHTDPTGWEDPVDTSTRKCTLNCQGCHVSPSGAGMRTESGIYYGKQVLPIWGSRPADQAYKSKISQRTQATPTPASAPSSQPYVDAEVPAPGTAGRYGGITPHPTFQIGADYRLMAYIPNDTTQETAIFPMQADVHLAYRPYNPGKLNQGRVTTTLTAGFQGSRGDKFDNAADRAFVREWYAMYHDLPDNMYARAGRFLPAIGWRTDDHTEFVRQGQIIMGQPFDTERQVTGIEVGYNPNYLFMHASIFNAADQWDSPVNTDDGFGGALMAGWRDLNWHLSGSVIYGTRPAEAEDIPAYQQVAWGAQWGLNLAGVNKLNRLPDGSPLYAVDSLIGINLPIIYLGEFVFNNRFPERGRNTLGLAASHELDWLITRGINFKLRYDWRDGDTDVQFDSQHRATTGFEIHPYTYTTVIAQYRHNWNNSDTRFKTSVDEMLLIMRAWY